MNNSFINKMYCYKPPIFIFILFCLSFFSIELNAQNNANFEKLYKQAKGFYESKNYKKAIDVSKKAMAIDDKHLNTHLILAYSYEEIDSFIPEIFHLKKVLEIEEVLEVNYWLGEAYHNLEQYSEALFYYNRYKDYKYIPAKRKLILACKMADATFQIQALKNSINNNWNETDSNNQYWPVSSPDGKELLFKPLVGENEITTGNSFISEMDEENGNPIRSLENKTKDENGNSKVSAPEIIFFSACNRTDGLGDCDIYFSRIVDGIWSETQNAGASLNTEFSELQPTFSSENNTLYFSSNRPGGKGAKDIWSAKLTGFSEDGLPVWGAVENKLEINSEGNETSPFFDSKKQSLYFASDTRAGMGGFDLFQSTVAGGGGILDVQNLGYPINTNADELGLLVTYMHDTAYFTSARKSDTGLDIFAFNLTSGLHTEPSNYILIKLINKKTKQAIQSDIELVDLTSGATGNSLETLNNKGEKILRVRTKRNYQINISENGYMFYSKQILQEKSNTLEDPFVLAIELDPIEIGAEIDLYSIYYEVNSYDILPASEPELDRLVNFLSKNKDLKVEIQGHTDSTGDVESNLQLSEQRAKSVIDYLVRKRISVNRLKHIGFGDKVPIASNDTEDGRRLNRRTTIKITEL